MLVLVSYDIATADRAGERRLRRIGKICGEYGQRVQYSIFECMVDPAQWTMMRRRLLDEASLKNDSLRFYFLGNKWRGRIEHHGAKPAYDPEGPLIV